MIAIYFLLMAFSIELRKTQEPSAAMEKFKKAEKLWSENMQNPAKLENLVEKHPVTVIVYNLISFLILGIFSIGLIFDFFLLFRPGWRRAIMRHVPPDDHDWPVHYIFKVAFWWMFIGLATSLLIAFLHKTILPGMTDNFAAIFHTTLMDVLCFALIALVIKTQQGNWKDLGFRIGKNEIVREVGIGFAGYMAILPVFFIVLIFLVAVAKLFAYEPQSHPLVEIFLEEEKRSPVLIVYSVFLATVLGPVMEEVFFRGFCYPILKRRLGMGWSMAITSAFFAMIHQNEFAFWPIFVLGMGLAFIYEKRRNLVAPITLHIVHNCFFIAYFFLAKQAIVTGSS